MAERGIILSSPYTEYRWPTKMTLWAAWHHTRQSHLPHWPRARGGRRSNRLSVTGLLAVDAQHYPLPRTAGGDRTGDRLCNPSGYQAIRPTATGRIWWKSNVDERHGRVLFGPSLVPPLLAPPPMLIPYRNTTLAGRYKRERATMAYLPTLPSRPLLWLSDFCSGCQARQVDGLLLRR